MVRGYLALARSLSIAVPSSIAMDQDADSCGLTSTNVANQENVTSESIRRRKVLVPSGHIEKRDSGVRIGCKRICRHQGRCHAGVYKINHSKRVVVQYPFGRNEEAEISGNSGT
jgi:hypothetical protein